MELRHSPHNHATVHSLVISKCKNQTTNASNAKVSMSICFLAAVKDCTSLAHAVMFPGQKGLCITHAECFAVQKERVSLNAHAISIIKPKRHALKSKLAIMVVVLMSETSHLHVTPLHASLDCMHEVGGQQVADVVNVLRSDVRHI